MIMKIALLTLEAMLVCVITSTAQEVQPNSGPPQEEAVTQENRFKLTEIEAGSTTALDFNLTATLPLDTAKELPTLSHEQLHNLVLENWNRLPDNPQPRVGSKGNLICPAGVGNSCALLGGRVFYPDSIGLSYHDRTWWDAMKNPGMFSAMLTLIGTTVLDIEGSQACIDKHVCKELNPLMRGPKAHKYAVAMSANGLLGWLAVREKEYGRGISAFETLLVISVVHFYFGIGGLYEARTPQNGPGKVRSAH